MTLKSMTGFARHENQDALYSFTWEVKTVNSKGLDIRFRLPSGYDGLESKARELIGKICTRGSVNLNLNVSAITGSVNIKINHDLLRELAHAAQQLQKQGFAPPSAGEILALPGIIEKNQSEETEENKKNRENLIIDTLSQALQKLGEMRQNEGGKLGQILLAHLDEIRNLNQKARELAITQPAALRKKLHDAIGELLTSTPLLSEERLNQEVALLAVKADIKEELDRLNAHEKAAREMIEKGGAIGRKLDFLCQEFNREANTLCSKSADTELTNIGLNLKSSIEQMREQVQNLE